MAKEDSDFCLKQSPGREQHDCKRSKRDCEDLAKDVKRCCPKTCGSLNFTEDDCKQNKKQGSCTYPFYTLENECSESTNLSFRLTHLNTYINSNFRDVSNTTYYHLVVTTTAQSTIKTTEIQRKTTKRTITGK